MRPRRGLTVSLYVLALFGAHMAFLPLLVLVLPRRIEMLAGADAVAALSWVLLAGGITASLSHIVAGHLGDRWLVRFGSRRGLIAIGVAGLLVSYCLMAMAATVSALLVSFIVFQCTLNLAFAPLGALLTDYIPDASKGTVAGLMNAALPLASLAITVIAWRYPSDDNAAFLWIGISIFVTISPLLLFWNFEEVKMNPATMIGPAGPAGRPLSGRTHDIQPHAPSQKRAISRDFMQVWLARFMVQLGATFVLGYLYIYVTNQTDGSFGWPDANPSALIGQLSALVAVIAILAALASGFLSDASGRRRVPMAGFALCTAVALIVLAYAPNWALFIAAYSLFHLGLTGFLAVDTALVAQLLSGNPRRGMFLGLMNLTNSLPAILVPAIALANIWQTQVSDSLSNVFLMCAIGSALAAAAVMRVRTVQ
ncbi:MFS transporter [Pontixanthobacter sp.]|uniref:MFS transporter n=1 Tax=Pontixanthobacter sp. TaxID=2792078 RepID=UPI003C7D7D38